MNILLVTAPSGKETGLTYHRQLIPHSYISRHYNVKVTKANDVDSLTYEQLEPFDIVHFLREVDRTWQGKSRYTIERLRKLGKKIVFDIDDFWEVEKTHIFAQRFRQLNIPKQIEEIMSLVDLVTTTHDYMADMIRPLNKNVEVLVNALDDNEGQWERRKIDNNLLRFGWIGGVHHREDLSLMAYSINKLFEFKGTRDKAQVLLGGFNVTVSFSDDDEKQLRALGANIELMKQLNYFELCHYLISKQISVPVPEFVILEKIMTNEFKFLDRQYINYLRLFTPQMEHFAYNKMYRRLWGRDVFNYGQLYNDIDVALVPLVNNVFNNCKSQLKIIEAGFMGKAVICSNVHPYSIDMNEKMGCLVSANNNQMGWYYAMKRMLDEPNFRNDSAALLSEYIKKNYHIRVPSEKRMYLYQNLLK